MTGLSSSQLRTRALAASIVAITGAVVFRLKVSGDSGAVYIPVVAMLVGAFVIHIRSLGAQLLGRALFWSNFVLGSFLCFVGSNTDRVSALGLLIGCGLALVFAERRALAQATDARGVRPAAFAGTIELLMVLALGDAQTCVLLGAAVGKAGHGLSFFVAAGALVVGFIGLYRLALWGVVVTMSTATMLAFALLSGVVWIDDVSVPFSLVFGLQIFAPLPMLYSLATKRALPEPSGRVRSAAASIFIVAVMLVSVLAALRHGQRGAGAD